LVVGLVNEQNLSKSTETFSNLDLLDLKFIKSQRGRTHSSVIGGLEQNLSLGLVNDQNISGQETGDVFVSLVDDGIFHGGAILNLGSIVGVRQVEELRLHSTQTWLITRGNTSSESSQFDVLSVEFLSWNLLPVVVVGDFFGFLEIGKLSRGLEIGSSWERRVRQ
jgi:hypothetical protein